MSDISQVKLPDGTTYNLKDSYVRTNYRALSNNNFDTINVTELNGGDAIFTGAVRFTNKVFGDNNTTYSLSASGESVVLSDSDNSSKSVSLSTLINGLSEGSSPATSGDYIIAQYAGGGTTTNTYHRRKLSNVFKAMSSNDITTALGYTPPHEPVKDIPNTPTAIATFSDGANLPMPKLEVGIEPVQEGSGDPSPTNVRPISGWDEVNVGVVGKNLLNESALSNNRLIDGNGNVNDSSVTKCTEFYIKIKGLDTITVSYDYESLAYFNDRYYAFYDENKDFVSSDKYTPTSKVNQISIPNNAVYIRISFDMNITNIMIEEGTTATTYEPYNGQTYTLDLDGTRYGGKVDLVSGVMVVTHMTSIYDGSNDEGWALDSNSNRFFIINDEVKIGSGRVPVISNIGKYSETGREIGTIFAFQASGHMLIYYYPPSNITSVSDYKTWLSTNNLQVCYELATPLTIQLPTTVVKSLRGKNNVFADSGDVCVTYVTQEYNNMTAKISEFAQLANTASKLGSSNVGSATQPIYLSAGTATACTYTLGKSVPSDAVFTDTKNTAGSTDTSSKIYLIGATSQAANPQTYSDDQVYVTSGTLQTNNTYATVSLCANTGNSGTAGGVSLYGSSPTAYGLAMRGTGNGGKHGAVQGDWAIYSYMNGYNTARGWIWRNSYSNNTNIASLDVYGNAVFNGYVGIGGNETNTSGVRQVYNSTTKSLDFVFVA